MRRRPRSKERGYRAERGLLRNFKGGEERFLRRGEAAVDADSLVFLFFALDVAEGVELGDDIVTRVRDEEFGGAELMRDLFDAAVRQGVEIFAGAGADEDGVGHELTGALAERVGGGVVFIEYSDDGLVVGAELGE